MAERIAIGVRLARPIRKRLQLDASAMSAAGTVRLGQPAVARDVAHRLGSAGSDTVASAMVGSGPIGAAEVLALGLLDEVARTVLDLYGRRIDPAAFARAETTVTAQIGAVATAATLAAHGLLFPPPLTTGSPAGEGIRELLLTWLAAANPALGPLRPLVDDAPLAGAPGSGYGDAIEAIRRHFASAPSFGPDGQDLVTLLRAPMAAVPGSLAGQLRFVRARWGALIGDGDGAGLLDRLDVGLGVIEEEEVARTRSWLGGGRGGGGGTGALDDLALGLREDIDGSGLEPDPEPERFSSDVAWMPGIVLMAKSTHVWLDQLSRTYAREIRTLNAIPDEELDRLARAGVTGLWLIGVWERSRASREIKRRRGNPDALASAYALQDYDIAADLGGPGAADNLRGRAAARGIRLASDMVPNHMGIDARWVIEHPDWFLQLRSSPYPAYSFSGPDLSWDDRVAILLEDHYWDGTDAAVVFKRVDRATGDERYVYHGNDGTSFPWNDTAQLDYVRADVREAVIQTILHVARQFPVIRFDAAMVLAKRHIERLWHPLPGSGGAIPSRAEHAMTKRAFDAAIPIEFWREVVDRIAVEAPGTLLLAEAFWLMEGYFVRTLGMHRVYNSAFMNLLRDEDNAGYRRVMRETLEFDPQIIGRFVNFMSNPDEKTAVEQFGTGDKHFGVATVLATMPGLPMLGHGQLEGFRERYGMEFSKAAWEEPVDEGMLARYEREIVPLLHRRAWFAGSRDFLLYDANGDGGGVVEDVYAYSNIGPAGERSLVVFHNRYAPTAARVRESVGFSVLDGATGERVLRRRILADGLDVWRGSREDPAIAGAFVRAREAISGLEYAWPARDVVDGLRFELGPYDYRVYLEWATVRDAPDGRWARLVATLGGRGVPSLDGELMDIELAPVHVALRAVLTSKAGAASLRKHAAELVTAVRAATGAGGGAKDRAVVTAIVGVVAATDRLANATRTTARARSKTVAATERSAAATERSAAAPLADPTTTAAFLARAVVEPLGLLGDSDDSSATIKAWWAELRLGPALDRILREAGELPASGGPVDASAAVHLTWLLFGLPRPGSFADLVAKARPLKLGEAWLSDPDIAAALGVHEAEGQRWLVAEGLERVIGWASAVDAVGSVPPSVQIGVIAPTLRKTAKAAGYRVDAWVDRLGRTQRTRS